MYILNITNETTVSKINVTILYGYLHFVNNRTSITEQDMKNVSMV